MAQIAPNTDKVRTNVITLVTLNAKYIHASLGLRYLLANMGKLRAQARLREFTIARKAQDIVDELLAEIEDKHDGKNPGIQIIGFGVYIWNVVQTTAVIRLLKTARPDLKIVLGGPEVSYETNEQEITRLADHVITGWGDLSFAKLCDDLLCGRPVLNKIIVGEQPQLSQIALPYDEYSESDLAHRLLYVEASRGCPFKCHFCLSSLDKTAWAFDLEAFLAQMYALYQRGARNFKFVDRTFNLKVDASIRILQFFLDRLSESEGKLFVHFEVVPDHLPEQLKQIIARFPPGVLQFEVGIQSFNPEVQQRISRKQDNEKTEANLRWLLAESNAHIHADLIFGLPGETLESFANGFDRLYALQAHEIQLGVLKRLRGTPISQHTTEFGMVYDSAPPYSIRQTNVIDAATMQRFIHLARYWDLIANSGRFGGSLKMLMSSNAAISNKANSPFYAFLGFSDWFWGQIGETSKITPERLVDALFTYLTVTLGFAQKAVLQTLLSDYQASGARAKPECLRDLLAEQCQNQSQALIRNKRELSSRQDRHLAVKAQAARYLPDQ